MVVWGEIPLDPTQKLLLAEWKMQPQQPSAASDKGRYLIFPQSVNKHSRREDILLSRTNGEVVSPG